MAKFQTKPKSIDAVRITSKDVGPVGDWFVTDGDAQSIVPNAEFVQTYKVPPPGRPEVKEMFAAALADAGVKK